MYRIMRFSNGKYAPIEPRKRNEYLLNRNPPDVRGKSAFFIGRYDDNWKQLRDDRLEHVAGPVLHTEETRHDTTYVVEETVSDAHVRSVWIIRTGESFPRLVTAYPID